MKKENKNSTNTASLREKAEEQLKKKHSVNGKSLTVHNSISTSNGLIEGSKGSEIEMIRLVHELEVYHIELEMQNEELKIASEKAQTATEKYTAIYDFAYTGYFTLDTKGNICELNHSGALMLGKERSKLVKGNFKQFVTMDTRSEFDDFFKKVFETTTKQNCDVRLIVKGNPSIFAHLEAIISGEDEKCLVTVVDITKRKQAEGILELKAHEYKLFSELVLVSDQQMIELKKEINHLLIKLGEKEKYF
ncbi:MAG TPA: hypothetical protein DCL77_09410 [Prolixibacteraceae bacterium]|nr:hypothetical protein [Prolixibacteraceae bacterium]